MWERNYLPVFQVLTSLMSVREWNSGLHSIFLQLRGLLILFLIEKIWSSLKCFPLIPLPEKSFRDLEVYVDLSPFSILLRSLIYTGCPHWGTVHIVTFILISLYTYICVRPHFTSLLFLLSAKAIISQTLSCWTCVFMAYAVFCISGFLIFKKYGNFRAIAFVNNLLKSLLYSRHQLVHILDQHCLWLHSYFPVVFLFSF